MRVQGTHDVNLAATVEFIHTATLLHDDVVDKSAQRRGRPTANLLYDNKSSVLVGDYLFARAFQLMVEPGSIRVLDILSNASATIAEGEVLQLTAARDLRTDEACICRWCAARRRRCFRPRPRWAACSPVRPKTRSAALFTYGDALGIAFQIVDDLLDYEGDATATGKNVGDDFRERKLTLPVIKAVAAGNDGRARLLERTIEKGDQRDGDLEHALDLLHAHGALDRTRADAKAWIDTARAALQSLPEHPVRDMLDGLADYVVARIN